MDPERVRAYLQVACAGLGFDIGEIWLTTTENGSSSVASVDEPLAENGSYHNGALVDTKRKQRHLRFVQLYTSKSFENKRKDLVNPPDDQDPPAPGLRRSSSVENLQKHVLSPRLVDAISSTAQVVWANTRKREGLIGRSDILLQTAVGMPVAIDGSGNMWVVVMFSPNNLQSSDDAMDYLQSISQSATSTSIPCLLPVLDPSFGMRKLPHHLPHERALAHPDAGALGEGVTARFVSFDDAHRIGDEPSLPTEPEVHSEHELWTAPKDTFGIPMLPAFAELGNVTADENIDVFDEASYGVWTTIMDLFSDNAPGLEGGQNFDLQQDLRDGLDNPLVQLESDDSDVKLGEDIVAINVMTQCQRGRLEEFCSAFLGMSVFDLADVWVPASSDSLTHVMSVTSTQTNELLNSFVRDSEHIMIKHWNGAIGRAYSSGNPVWSANPNVFVDSGRAQAFYEAKILTVLAVPVFSSKKKTPACVVSCYSLVRSGSVPFVLRFVQQALRLLWDGLENVEPHESVGPDIWKDVAPADLGEMAADLEMQQHFMSKKRPRTLISDSERSVPVNTTDGSQTSRLLSQFQTITLPSGDTISVPMQLSDDVHASFETQNVDIAVIQNSVNEAVRSISNAVAFSHVSVATNTEGTKRAHCLGPISGSIQAPMPIPRAFPTQVLSAPASRNISPLHASLQCRMLISPTMSLNGTPQTGVGDSQMQLERQESVVSENIQKAIGSHAPIQSQIVFFPLSENFCLPSSSASSEASISSNSKICRIQGCDDPAVSRRPYCMKHSGNRICEHAGCNKCAQGATRFCIAHGGGRRCTIPGCDKGARDKLFCAAHGGGKRCKHDGCSKSAVGGSQLCTAHGGGRRCSIEGCDKSAQSSTKFCVKHGGGKKCLQDGCEKVARGRTLYCASHGGGVRCKLDGCNRVAIGRFQLCRAHGGGSRSKGGSDEDDVAHESPSSSPEHNPLLSPQNQVLLDGLLSELTRI